MAVSTNCVISALRAASQLPGRGPTDVDDAPACTCMLIKNLITMMMIIEMDKR